MEVSEDGTVEVDVIFVGGGPAGCCCALYTARTDQKTIILDKNHTVEVLVIMSHITNYLGVDKTISKNAMLDQMSNLLFFKPSSFCTKEVMGLLSSKGTAILFPSKSSGTPPKGALERRLDLATAAKYAASILGTPLTDETILACYIVLEELDPRNDWFTLYPSTLPIVMRSVLEKEFPVGMLPICYATAAETTCRFMRRQYEVCVMSFAQLPDGAASRSLPFDWFIRAVNAVQSRSFSLNETHHRLEPQNPHCPVRYEWQTTRVAPPQRSYEPSRGRPHKKIDRSDKTWRLISIKSGKKREQMFGCALSPTGTSSSRVFAATNIVSKYGYLTSNLEHNLLSIFITRPKKINSAGQASTGFLRFCFVFIAIRSTNAIM